jgi:AcrR family transcriptional regulator
VGRFVKPGGKEETGMKEEVETGLPASFEAAWGVRGRPSRGPRPRLSLERIVDAAVGIATAEGLDAVSMSRVAAELNAGTMALYRYVGSKDELLALMVDAALGPPPAVRRSTSWRAGLSTWARSYMEVLRRGPWVVRVPIGGPPITPNQIAWFDQALHALRRVGLDGGEKVSVLVLLSGYVRSQATLEADLLEAFSTPAGPGGQVAASYGEILRVLIDSARFPALFDLVGEGTFDTGTDEYDANAEFEFGLRILLDGMESLVRPG